MVVNAMNARTSSISLASPYCIRLQLAACKILISLNDVSWRSRLPALIKAVFQVNMASPPAPRIISTCLL